VGDRITIVLDPMNTEKLRNIQAKMIRSSSKSVSFSHVLNLVVNEGLKKFKVNSKSSLKTKIIQGLYYF
jgi:hypothetical protein